MTPVYHVVSSAAFGGFFFFACRSLSAAVACFVAGVIIDVDHFVDYLFNKRRVRRLRSLGDFYTACIRTEFDKLYLILHSYELLAALWVIIVAMRLGLVWLAIAVGITQHMLLDQIGNKALGLTYFFIFRLRHNFSAKYLFAKKFIHA